MKGKKKYKDRHGMEWEEGCPGTEFAKQLDKDAEEWKAWEKAEKKKDFKKTFPRGFCWLYFSFLQYGGLIELFGRESFITGIVGAIGVVVLLYYLVMPIAEEPA